MTIRNIHMKHANLLDHPVERKRVNILLLCNTSDYMSEETMASLNCCINRMSMMLMKDSCAGLNTSICMMGFHEYPYLIQDWCKLYEMKPFIKVANGDKDFANAMPYTKVKLAEVREEGIENIIVVISEADGKIEEEMKQLQSIVNPEDKVFLIHCEDYLVHEAMFVQNHRKIHLFDEDNYEIVKFFDYLYHEISDNTAKYVFPDKEEPWALW